MCNFGLGAIDSPEDLRDYDYSMLNNSEEEIEIPESFKLDYDIPVQNQGKVGSCVAHSLMEMKSYIDNNMYSIGFIYGNREENDWQGRGMVIREALKNIVKFGDCKKESFDFNIEYPLVKEKMKEIGIDKLLTEASQFKSLAYISLNKSEIKEYLVKYQKPILITVRVYDNFYLAQTNGGYIPKDKGEILKGSHAMVIIGYDKDKLILVNSWGNTGDNGYYYLDINSSIIKELWALEDVKNVNRPVKNKYTIGWNKIKEANWNTSENKWQYSKDGINLIKNEWLEEKGLWYYFDENGTMVTKWKLIKNKWYYFDIDKGYAICNKWYFIDGKWYVFNKKCEMITGWYQNTNGKWSYLDINKGYAYHDCTILIEGKNYTFDSHCYWIENNSLVSDACIDFIKSWEGYYAKPYYDCVGVKTLGYGMTGEEIEGIDYVTEEQATQMLKDWINKKYVPPIKKDLDSKGVTLKSNEFHSLISFAYNCGVGALLGSTLYKNICNGVRDENTIISNFTAWSNGGGHRIEGLYRRRCKEANMFLYGDYTGNN